MHEPARDYIPLVRSQLDHLAWIIGAIRIEIDHEQTRQDEEEFVVAVMLVPVILPFHHTESNDGVVHPTQCLIEPLVLHRRDERVEIEALERRYEDIEMRCVRVARGEAR